MTSNISGVAATATGLACLGGAYASEVLRIKKPQGVNSNIVNETRSRTSSISSDYSDSSWRGGELEGYTDVFELSD